MAMTLIQSQVLSSSAASVTFSNIPQTFKALQLLVSARADGTGSGGENIRLRFNGTTTAYYDRLLYGNGSSALSTANSNTVSGFVFQYANGGNLTANTFASSSIYIPNYTSSAHKALSSESVVENNNTTSIQGMAADLWQNTAAVSLLTLELNTPGINFVSGSSFTLYGIN